MFFDWFWNLSSKDIITIITSLTGNVVENVISLMFYPFNIDVVGENEGIQLALFTSGIQGRVISKPVVTIDMGSITIPAVNNYAIEMETAMVYIPYVGIYTMPLTKIIGKTIRLTLKVDITCRTCCAIIKVGGSIVQMFNGTCGCEVPFTLSNGVSYLENAINTVQNFTNKNITGVIGTSENVVTNVSLPSTTNSNIYQTLPNYAMVIVNAKNPVSQGSGYNHAFGRPCCKSYKLSSLSGFTQVLAPHIDNWVDTNWEDVPIHPLKQEVEMIYALMKEGVIL